MYVYYSRVPHARLHNTYLLLKPKDIKFTSKMALAIAVGRIIVLGGGMLRIFAAASVEEQEDGYYDSYFDFYDDGGGVTAGVPAEVSDERILDHISDSSEETRSGKNKNKNKKVCSSY